jgi:hypothetical protein
MRIDSCTTTGLPLFQIPPNERHFGRICNSLTHLSINKQEQANRFCSCRYAIGGCRYRLPSIIKKPIVTTAFYAQKIRLQRQRINQLSPSPIHDYVLVGVLLRRRHYIPQPLLLVQQKNFLGLRHFLLVY